MVQGSVNELCTELVIRLCNEFPTTEREVREFEQRTRMHADKLDQVVDGMLGSSLGKSLTEAEREQMKPMVTRATPGQRLKPLDIFSLLH